MWGNYEQSYAAALQDESFVSWRDAGAKQKALNIVEVCRGIVVDSVIEIGCGTGAVLRRLRQMEFASTYACTDVSFSAVRFASGLHGGASQLAFVGSAAALPIRDGSFSVALLSHVIEHVDNPLAAVQEASRIAGHVVVEVPIERVLSNFIRTRILGRPTASIGEAGHIQFWSPRSIVSFLEDECRLEILSRHRDLLSRDMEFFAKKGIGFAKPVVKQVLKILLPASVYSNVLTTHVTFLLRSASRRRET